MGTTLSSTTPWSGTLDVLPARSARKDLVTYFSQLPTHEVNFYHDFSKPAHHHMHSRHPTRHGLDRGSAYREIEHYYSNVPSRDVNPNHDPADPPKHSRVHAFSSEVAMRDMNDFYDRQDPGNMQVARPAVAKNKAKLSDTSSDSQESRATSLGFGAGHSDGGQLVAGSNQVEASVKAAIGTVGTAAMDTVGKGNLLPRSSIAYIQQWGHDADAPTVSIKELREREDVHVYGGLLFLSNTLCCWQGLSLTRRCFCATWTLLCCSSLQDLHWLLYVNT